MYIESLRFDIKVHAIYMYIFIYAKSLNDHIAQMNGGRLQYMDHLLFCIMYNNKL